MTTSYSQRARSTRGAFTLVEILVALAVMMVMMVIILVPINMGMDLFHIGKARAEVQQANQLVVNQLAAELKQAVHVFPNEAMAGITDKVPYTNNATAPNYAPYYDTTTATRVANTARLDFLLPSVGTNGAILTPPVANNYIVTYYARRLNPTLDDGTTDIPYDVFSNPVVLWRAQYPYRQDDGNTSTVANLLGTRYDDFTLPRNNWLTQTAGEPNLVTQSTYAPATAAASHTQLTPRDMVLVLADQANPPTTLQPDSSFIGDDTNGDGKIDRVTISLLLGKYDSIGAAGDKRQQIRSTQTVTLPNIR